MRKVEKVNKRKRSESAVNNRGVTCPERSGDTARISIPDKKIDRVAAKVVNEPKIYPRESLKERAADSTDYVIYLCIRAEIESALVITGNAADLRSSGKSNYAGKKGLRGYPIFVDLSCLAGKLNILPLIESLVAKQPKLQKSSINATSVKKLVAVTQKMGKAVTSIKAAPDGSVTVSVGELHSADHHPLNPFDVVLK